MAHANYLVANALPGWDGHLENWLWRNEYGVLTCRDGTWHLRDDRRCEACERERIDALVFMDMADDQVTRAISRVGIAMGLSPSEAVDLVGHVFG